MKVWFEPQGKDLPGQDEVAEKMKALQLATASARLEELERRAGAQTTRAQKEKQRKQKQKAVKKTGSTGRLTRSSAAATAAPRWAQAAAAQRVGRPAAG